MNSNTAIKLSAHTLIAAGITIWLDMLRGCTFNADQIVGLTIMFALAGLLIQEIVKTWLARKPAAQVDVMNYFEEI